MILRRPLIGMVAAWLLLITSLSQAATRKIDRYLSFSMQPKPAQQQLWQQTVEVKFPPDILTLNDAVKFLLKFSGYHLNPHLSNKTQILLNQPLAEIDRQLPPLSFETALLTLIGKHVILLIDPIHRLVDFKIKPIVRGLYPNIEIIKKRSSL